MASRSQNNYVKKLASIVGVIATLPGNGAIVNTFWCCSIQAKNGCNAIPAKLAVDKESWKIMSGNGAVADCPLRNYWLDPTSFLQSPPWWKCWMYCGGSKFVREGLFTPTQFPKHCLLSSSYNYIQVRNRPQWRVNNVCQFRIFHSIFPSKQLFTCL